VGLFLACRFAKAAHWLQTIISFREDCHQGQMMKRFTVTLLTVLLAIHSAGLKAGSAAPIVFELEQPDGTTFEAIRRGDEYRNWIETLDGRSIVEDNGAWFYAERDASGQLAATIHAVGGTSAADLKSIPLHIAPQRDPDAVTPRTIRKLQRTVKNTDLQAQSAMALPHQQYLLTVLVDYSDIGFNYSDSSFQSRIYGSSGSVKDFFMDNSYGAFTIAAPVENYGSSNDGIIHIKRARAHPNQGDDRNTSRQEAREIVALTDAYVNYANYDANGDGVVSPDELSIMIILAGYETSYGAPPSPSVWGHAMNFASSLTLDGVDLQLYTMFGERHENHQATIGVMCHELGHLMLGLPDLYDTDDSSAGIGDWGLMGSGEWNYAGGFSGNSPAHLGAWSKVATNLTVPQDIDSSQSAVILAKADSNESARRIWIDKYKLREYFLVENRQKSGYDAGLPGSGLLIWHVDENQDTNADENHKLVDLEEADGFMQLDDNANDGDTGDPFPGLRNKTSFNDASSPNSRDYAGNATQIAVTNVSASAASMTADMTPRAAGAGDHAGYFENGNMAGLGFSGSTVWMGMRTKNDTAHAKFDGVDVYVNDPVGATIDIKYYTSLSGGTPAGLIHTQAGFNAGPGWNRLLLATPQDFPVGAERGIVLKVVNNSASYPAVFTPSDNGSGRAYIDDDGNGAFYPICPSFCGDFNLAALFSDTQTAPLPDPPSQVSASDGAYTDKVLLSWSAVAAATAYNVYYSSSIGAGKILVGQFGGTSANITGFNPGEVLYFWVYSVNANGESASGAYDTGYIQAVVPDPADLALTAVNAANGAYAPGASLLVSSTVENSGGTVSGVYRLTLYASSDTVITTGDRSLGFKDYTALAAGAIRTDSVLTQLPASLANGQYYIGAILSGADVNAASKTKSDPVPVTIDSAQQAFQINAGLNDAWYYQVTTGQGFFITVFPQLGYVSLSWFTYDTARPAAGVTANLGEPGHRWLNAVGPYSGSQAVLDVSYASGGLFDSPTPVGEISDGTIILNFSDCDNGTVQYDIPSIGQQGTVPIQRVVSDNVTLCETLSQQAVTQQSSYLHNAGDPETPQSGDAIAKTDALAIAAMNPGLNDAWYYPVTTGQGFFINVFPVLGYVTLSWFTYDTDRPPEGVTANLGEPGHRWLNALGQINGNQAVMNVSYASGGLFDSPEPVEEINDGTITLTFTDCNTGTVEYDIPSIGRQGTVPIKRVADDNIALCESLITP
jgi:immune inhibitor A